MNSLLGQKRLELTNEKNEVDNQESSMETYKSILQQIRQFYDQNDLQNTLKLAIGLININFSKNDLKLLVSEVELQKLLNCISYYENTELKTYYLILINNILDKEIATINLSKDQLTYFFNQIYLHVQNQSNDNLLYMKEIFRLLSYLESQNKVIFNILNQGEIIQLFDGLLRFRQQMKSLNQIIYYNFYDAFLEFFESLTENEEFQNSECFEKILKILITSIEYVQLDDMIDLKILQQIINIYNNGFDFQSIDQNQKYKMFEYIYKQSNRIFIQCKDQLLKAKQELEDNTPLEYHQIDKNLISYLTTTSQCLIFYIKFFESDFFTHIQISENERDEFIASIIKISDWNQNLLNQFFNFIQQKKTDFWTLIGQFQTLVTQSSSLLINFSHSLISSIQQTQTIIQYLFYELKKQFSLQMRDEFFDLQVLNELAKTLIVYIEINNNQAQPINIDAIEIKESIDLINYFLINKKDQNLIENLINMLTQVVTYFKKFNSPLLSQFLESIVKLTFEILNEQNIESSFSKAALLDLIFVVYGDEEFNNYYTEQLNQGLSRTYQELSTRLKFNVYLHNHEKMGQLEESVENLEQFLEYKRNNQ